MGLWSIVVLLAFIAIMAWRVVRRGFQMRDLVLHGQPVKGEVVNKVTFRGGSGVRSRYLRYRFTVNGQEYSHKIAVSSRENEAYREGGPIDLVYLPENPRVSATAAMVEMTRGAMKQPESS